ncbi:arsenical-resistance protein [Hyaloraphidium curvatum]|nr:arsenical-resistance protein [Hyaloraphidium curvatum]
MASETSALDQTTPSEPRDADADTMGGAATKSPPDVPVPVPAHTPKPPAQLSLLDKLLPVLIIGAMIVGVLLGVYVPGVQEALGGPGTPHIADVSLPIALGLWLMMLPVLTKVRYELLGLILKEKQVAKELAISTFLNWVIGPALMTGLAWACLPDLPNYRAGVIMVGLARCIAMVLIWNQLADGDPELCAVTVALNSILQILLYAPLAMLYLGPSYLAGASGFWLVAKSVLIFLGVPLVLGVILRYSLILIFSRSWLDKKFLPYFGPVALLALVYTVIVLFASQGPQIVSQIGAVARTAVPMLIYFCLMWAASFAIAWYTYAPYAYAVTQAFTASSNNFELAIAVAVSTFGYQSEQALAATVGPLIEVPVLLALVYVARWARTKWYADRDRWLYESGKVKVLEHHKEYDLGETEDTDGKAAQGQA